MAQDFATSYAEIIKYDKNDDGTITVYGKATSDDLDIDQQICDNDWLGKAMPEWFKSGGNIREQHSSIAAGVAQELETKSDGYYVTALVVDPTSVKKVESKVLKGFSIGIKGPRVVRDEKAANGRIVDGQIVEVSLVDRPANPSCQLVLAKAVGAESTLTQVEELIEKGTDYGKIIPERKGSPASAIVDLILEMHEKSVSGSIVKFDQASYDTARRALAQLIIAEATEMGDGSDERDDIDTLLSALKHLFNFYDGEVEEGEAMATDADMLEMSTEAEAAKGDSVDCTCDGCKECKDAGGCDKSPCSKCMMAKSALVGKCLECGCHNVGATHGLTQVAVAGAAPTHEMANVSTADSLNTDGSIKSAEGEEVVAEEKAEEETAAEDNILDEAAVAAIVEKATKSATEIVKAEMAESYAALKAAKDKVSALESELVTAKSAVVQSGPKRTGRTAVTNNNELLLKAAEYRLKASATSDQILAKGYKALEKEYLSKAGETVSEE